MSLRCRFVAVPPPQSAAAARPQPQQRSRMEGSACAGACALEYLQQLGACSQGLYRKQWALPNPPPPCHSNQPSHSNPPQTCPLLTSPPHAARPAPRALPADTLVANCERLAREAVERFTLTG